ncbi:predicted protein [Coccidioides posadasii str. Silveira]|uniref:Predicted protein n=2 Tax=Coccidioides posadasii TaxID=199306 RepID=E9DFT6_COCPS|nr:predicted protein [Coccidioides posadasii str. Silveira]KMM63741.1 hypothetical protein CPAG_00095 [Coccidioides posadasii RMSCC 3488]
MSSPRQLTSLPRHKQCCSPQHFNPYISIREKRTVQVLSAPDQSSDVACLVEKLFDHTSAFRYVRNATFCSCATVMMQKTLHTLFSSGLMPRSGEEMDLIPESF